jgi:hypothetical protein
MRWRSSDALALVSVETRRVLDLLRESRTMMRRGVAVALAMQSLWFPAAEAVDVSVSSLLKWAIG